MRRPKIRARSTGYSSARYGHCECCHKHVSDVWIGTGNNGLSYVFGHETCVRIAIRKVAARKVAA